MKNIVFVFCLLVVEEFGHCFMFSVGQWRVNEFGFQLLANRCVICQLTNLSLTACSLD